MHAFRAPEVRAGWNRMQGMTESVYAKMNQEFGQNTKFDVLKHGPGRVVRSDSSGDEKACRDARKQERWVRMTFQAGSFSRVALMADSKPIRKNSRQLKSSPYLYCMVIILRNTDSQIYFYSCTV